MTVFWQLRYRTNDMDDSPIIFYYFYDFSDTDHFCTLLEHRFRASGHTRPIRFVSWNCYHEEPGRDGDLFIYDAVCMSALVDKGYLGQLPEIIDISDMFGWVIDKSKVRRKTYGVPLILCANALICRREDDRNIRNVMELTERVAIPMHSMLMYYYLQAFCNYQDKSGKSLQVLAHLKELMGGKEALAHSSFAEYNGIDRFNRKECTYFLGFTESLRLFAPDDYVVRFANFSDNDEDQIPLFMVDFASIGKNVREEKLLDCLDLLEILTDRQFLYDLCTKEGQQLQYMLPCSKSVYADLAKLDPLYDRFYELLLPEENGVFRYGPQFYEEFYKRSGELQEQLARAFDREIQGS